jgi:flavin reductase (DIM6/NTAB) family NADH-FMN oxidoreductase RutF
MNKKPIPLKRANRLINDGCTILVTSQYGDKESIITLAWQMPVSASPPMAAISVGPSRYSHDLISQSGQFVINVPPFSLLKETIYCGSVSGRDEDKFEGAGLTREPAQIVSAPLIAECIGHLECKVAQEVTAGDHTLFLGEVVAASAAERLWDEVWQVDKKEARTIHHLGGSFFCAPERIVKF